METNAIWFSDCGKASGNNKFNRKVAKTFFLSLFLRMSFCNWHSCCGARWVAVWQSGSASSIISPLWIFEEQPLGHGANEPEACYCGFVNHLKKSKNKWKKFFDEQPLPTGVLIDTGCHWHRQCSKCWHARCCWPVYHFLLPSVALPTSTQRDSRPFVSLQLSGRTVLGIESFQTTQQSGQLNLQLPVWTQPTVATSMIFSKPLL